MSFNINGRSYPVLKSKTNPTIHSKNISQQEHEFDTHSQQPSTLGLKLTRTHSMTVQIQQLQLALKRQKNNLESNAIMHENNKLNSVHFPITNLRIGQWQINSIRQGHLTAKIYFRRERLIWEILDGSLKKKIEILLPNIFAINKARNHENGTEILEIALKNPPLIQDEVEPQPGKHTKWKDTFDFTGGEASTWRIHVLQFPPGSLDENYDKLLNYYSRLKELSQKPFPSQISPYFQPNPSAFSQLSFQGDIKQPYLHLCDDVLALGRDTNPISPLQGLRPENELPFHGGLEIGTTTMVQPDNNYPNYPMLNVEQTPILSHPDTSLSNPHIQSEYIPDLVDEEKKYLWGLIDNPMVNVEFEPFSSQLTTMEPQAGESDCLSGRYDTFFYDNN